MAERHRSVCQLDRRAAKDRRKARRSFSARATSGRARISGELILAAPGIGYKALSQLRITSPL